MATRVGQGVHALPVDAYHLDPCVHEPSMSASDAEAMITRSARHCWTGQPRLNDAATLNLDVLRMDSSKRARLETGAALHRLVLGAGAGIVEIDADDYRGKDAKAARDDAAVNGLIPVLGCRMTELLQIKAAVEEQIARNPLLRRSLEAAGKAEQTLIWQERIGRGRKAATIWCRALVDWLPDDPLVPPIDFKFTTASAAPHAYTRTVAEQYGIRSVHYLRGLHYLRGRQPRHYLIVPVETEEPYGLSVHYAGEALLAEAREQWGEAAMRWHQCLRTGTHRDAWPLWSGEPVEAQPNPWDSRRWEERKLLEDMQPPTDGALRIKRGKPPGSMSVEQARALAASLGRPSIT